MSSQSADCNVHPNIRISPRSLHLACLLSRAILDFTRTFSRDDSRFQNIPNIFYGQDPFRSIVKSFHEIYCEAASHTIQCEGEKTAWVRLMAVIYRPFRDWSSELWRFAKLETLLSHGWLYVQLTIMANNTLIPSPSHHLTVGRQTMGRARVSEAIFQRRTKQC